MAVKNVEEYISKHPGWEEEIRLLRDLLLSSGMEESIKWGGPVYMVEGKNVASIGAFKNHFALWFFNGALLKENTALLHNAQNDKTNAMRQIRFEKGEEINPGKLEKYIQEAIQNQKEGKTVKPASKPLVVPDELKDKLKTDPELNETFQKLTKGKQREYADHISEAKRETTKQARLEKIIPLIKEGKGLYDKYKNC